MPDGTTRQLAVISFWEECRKGAHRSTTATRAHNYLSLLCLDAAFGIGTPL